MMSHIFSSDELGKTNAVYLFGKNYTNSFSRVAIHDDNVIKFELTYVIGEKKRKHFEEAIKKIGYKVIIEIFLEIVTDNYVTTKCKCRSCCYGQNCANQITWEDKDPMIFFYGHEIVDKKTIKISGEANGNE